MEFKKGDRVFHRGLKVIGTLWNIHGIVMKKLL